MQDDSFPAAERILSDIEGVFKKDPKLREFDIVPVTVNHNKSPVLHVEHCLGLESWCVRHVYCYAYHRLMDARQLRTRREDPAMLARWLSGALLLNPDVTTFWNMRRELMQAGRLDVHGELHFTAVLLSRKPKCAEAFAHRKWVIGRLLLAGVDADELLEEEIQVSQFAADRYPNNYHAWSHRMWCLTHLSTSDIVSLLKEWSATESWVSSHVSDHSGMQYRQFLLSRLLELKQPVSEDIEKVGSKSLEQLLTCKAIQVPSINNEGDNSIIDSCNTSALIKCVGIIASELLLNMDLITRFSGHEALWCHRRYLLMTLKEMLNCRGVDMNNIDDYRYRNIFVTRNKCTESPRQTSPVTVKKGEELSLSFLVDCQLVSNEGNKSFGSPQEEKASSHKNVDGIPLEKDQKLSSEQLDGMDKNLWCHLYTSLIWHEANLIKSCRPDELHQQRLANQHQKWLSVILKLDVPSVTNFNF